MGFKCSRVDKYLYCISGDARVGGCDARVFSLACFTIFLSFLYYPFLYPLLFLRLASIHWLW